jgi:hypothetical protein
MRDLNRSKRVMENMYEVRVSCTQCVIGTKWKFEPAEVSNAKAPIFR